MYDGRMGKTVAEFTPQVITRRQCTGVVAKVWNVLGKLATITLKMKYDLRRLIIDNPEWDSPLSAENRLKWVKNFKMIEDDLLRGLTSNRAPQGIFNIPESHADTMTKIVEIYNLWYWC